MSVLDILGKRMLFFDGGMGTMLQKKGVKPGEITEIWNITRPEDVYDVHCEYLVAGADIIMANTFGANCLKLAGTGRTGEFRKLSLVLDGVDVRITNRAFGACSFTLVKHNMVSAFWAYL
jgi:methionine synthase I (cobalamin-dependent)